MLDYPTLTNDRKTARVFFVCKIAYKNMEYGRRTDSFNLFSNNTTPFYEDFFSSIFNIRLSGLGRVSGLTPECMYPPETQPVTV